MSFLAKAIDRAQQLPPEDARCVVITDYLFRNGKMAYDGRRDLFWVDHPAGWQVAVWMMPPLGDTDE